MGRALAGAALEAGHEVVIVSGPVELKYPSRATVVPVVSTEEMLQACLDVFPQCDGLIGVAAPCDYRPVQVAKHKIAKTGDPLKLHLVETADIVATLGDTRQSQWLVAFALETEDVRMRAMQKLERKKCDLIVLNGPSAIQADSTAVEIIDRSGNSLARLDGNKDAVARGILQVLDEHLIRRATMHGR